MFRTWTLRVTGRERLHCVGCEERVARALSRFEGIETVSARAATQRIIVIGDPLRWTTKTLCSRIEKLGYHVVEDAAGGDNA